MTKAFFGAFGAVAFSLLTVYGFIVAFHWSLTAAVRIVEVFQ